LAYGDKTLLAGAVIGLIQQAVRDGKQIKEKGTPAAEIEKIMKARGFSPHNAKRIIREVMGEALADDIPAAEIINMQELKSNCTRITVRRDFGIDLHDIVRFRSRDYQAQKVERRDDLFLYTLKSFARTSPDESSKPSH